MAKKEKAEAKRARRAKRKEDVSSDQPGEEHGESNTADEQTEGVDLDDRFL